MTEWFTQQQAGLIGGIGGGVLGGLAGVFGGVAGVLVNKGIGRRAVLGVHLALVVLAVLLVGVGITAVVMGQPHHVSYPFCLVGVVLLFSLGFLYPVMRKRYRQAEERRMQAQDLRRG